MDKIMAYKKICDGGSKVQEMFVEAWVPFIVYWNRKKTQRSG